MEESDVHLSHVYVFPDIFSYGVNDEEWIAGESSRGSSLLGNPYRFRQMIPVSLLTLIPNDCQVSLSLLFQNLSRGDFHVALL